MTHWERKWKSQYKELLDEKQNINVQLIAETKCSTNLKASNEHLENMLKKANKQTEELKANIQSLKDSLESEKKVTEQLKTDVVVHISDYSRII